MFGTALIVFRETLEAAIIIGILAAATHSVSGRTRWLVGGLLLGLLGAGIVGGFADVIGHWASGFGQELFNAAILGIAVLMLAWHSIWMSSHGAALAKRAHDVGHAIKDGRSECSMLMMLVSVAILREGSETALFLYGIATSAGNSESLMLAGGAIGLLVGAGVGYLLYASLIRVPLHWFFNVTGALVLLLAAGMASQAAGYLIQADILPGLVSPLWDTSVSLPEHSIIGTLLHGLIGYNARPDGMQVVFYTSALISIYLGMQLVKRAKQIK